ncbi:MAG: FHA domain-containing protein [Gammaproteobacteria bacterium]
MNTKASVIPLEIVIGDQIMRFPSVQEFEFSLNGRTAVPSQKISALMKLSPRELKAEAFTIAELEKRFFTMLQQAEDITINTAMSKLDPTIFSADHGWRGIIAELNECGEEYREYKHAALKKYMQYLASRKTLLMGLYTEKKSIMEQADEVKDHTMFSKMDKLSATANLESTMSGGSASDATQIFQAPPKRKPVTRHLSKGEPVIIQINTGENIELKLSKHKFRLSNVEGMELIDQEGQHYFLSKGRNVVGRDMECDISLNPAMKDISRKHLIIEYLGDNRLKLTDLSTHGTTITQ